jgi:hypothetical protein
MSATHAKPHRPNPIRRRVSCPNCGLNVDDKAGMDRSCNFTCPRCGDHYSCFDFWHHQYEKWQAQNHKLAEADLSGEQDE